MKTTHTFLSALLLTTAAMLPAYALPAGRPRNPPEPREISAPIAYQDLMLILTTKEGVAVVTFSDADDLSVKYHFRFLPKGADKEQTGEGKAFQQLVPNPNGRNGAPPVGFIETGDPYITVGPTKLHWAHNTKDRGWINYLPEQTTLQIANARDFDTVDLKRFAK